jgi:hypothetical protein
MLKLTYQQQEAFMNIYIATGFMGEAISVAYTTLANAQLAVAQAAGFPVEWVQAFPTVWYGRVPADPEVAIDLQILLCITDSEFRN